MGQRGFSRRKVVFLSLSSSLVMFSVTGILGAKVLPKVMSTDASYRYLSLFSDVLSLVRYNYVEPVDSKKIMHGAYKGAAEALDPYGAYLTPEEMKAQAEQKDVPAGSLGLEISKRFGYIVVISTVEDSPAAKIGIKGGDYIITVDDRSASDLSISQAMEAFKGPAGSACRLSVIRRTSRSGDPEDLEIKREEIRRPPTVAQTRDGILTVRMRDLLTDDVTKVRTEIATSGKDTPILLDLRDCTSDSASDAVALADLFTDQGEIVKVQDRRKGETHIEATKGTDTCTSPLFVLVNHGSAGAAEIVAAALQAQKRARIMGERTFGRASIQEVLPLSNGGGLRVTVAKYVAPGGTAIQGAGVDPDDKIAEPDQPEPAGDPVLDRAIELIHGANAAVPKAA
ncbi:MAG: S41 family peptidase [Acidobacteriota bacterium]